MMSLFAKARRYSPCRLILSLINQDCHIYALLIEQSTQCLDLPRDAASCLTKVLTTSISTYQHNISTSNQHKNIVSEAYSVKDVRPSQT